MKFNFLFFLTALSLLFFSCGKDKLVEPETIITLKAQSFEVLEAITDSDEIGKVVASSNKTAPLKFSITKNSDDLFLISADGVLGLATGKRLHFNVAASHQITIEATDDTKSISNTITINVIETLLTLEAQTFEVLETITDADEIGIVVASSSITAPLSYSITENPDDLFSISDDAVVGLATGKRLNFKTAASHEITIEVTDGTKTTSNKITINVIDVPDPFITIWKTNNRGQSNDNQITITTVDGQTYDYTVDWGDGSTNTNVTSHITHTYETAGTYTVSISGTFPGIFNNAETDALKIVSIEQWGDIEWKTMANAFRDCDNVSLKATDAPELSQVTNMSHMLEGTRYFYPDLNHWDVSNVTDMSYLFYESTFNGDISTWDVSNVINMDHMFTSTNRFNSDISNWDVSKVTNMGALFQRTSSFDADISNWDVSSVTDMNRMFHRSRFNVDISKWDVSNVTNMEFMFYESEFNVDLGDWDVSQVTTMTRMIQDSEFTKENYDALLTGWSTLTLQSNVSFAAGSNIKYSAGVQAARDILTNTYNWSIYDGGADF